MGAKSFEETVLEWMLAVREKGDQCPEAEYLRELLPTMGKRIREIWDQYQKKSDKP